MKFLFIGAGNMAQAIINGLINNKVIKNNEIYIYEINSSICRKLKEKYKINSIDDFSSINTFDYILLSVKPQVFNNFKNDNSMRNLAEKTTATQVIVSIMAGISIEQIKEFFINCRKIIRVMPNTPALIGQSMSVISAEKDIEPKNLEFVNKIFQSIGKTEILDEKQINAVTALSASGPAYVFIFIEALISGGVLCGLSKEIAEKLAVQTVLGASIMAGQDRTLEELRHMVTSPGGTTIAGIAELEKNAFRSSIIQAVKAAFKRAEELGKKSS
ncbi:MAG: pyrroline-5-carboxylate reductase [Spirochaetes bacterium]|nr:pyrroline-5-carboxylate reductase [Spirochaetota bacterium]